MLKFIDPPSYTDKPRLHHVSIARRPLDVRLPAIREALQAGADPNELNGFKNPGPARPLHYAICDSAAVDYRELKQNLPVVELLLEAGADPRLRDAGPGTLNSPIEELEHWFASYNENHSTWAEEDLGLYDFKKAALEAMKRVAAELDSKPAYHTLTNLANVLSCNRTRSQEPTISHQGSVQLLAQQARRCNT